MVCILDSLFKFIFFTLLWTKSLARFNVNDLCKFDELCIYFTALRYIACLKYKTPILSLYIQELILKSSMHLCRLRIKQCKKQLPLLLATIIACAYYPLVDVHSRTMLFALYFVFISSDYCF